MMTRSVRGFTTLLLCGLFLATSAQSAPRKKTTSRRKAKKAAAPVQPTATGTTFEERLASLVNSSIARTSRSSIEVVELESGRVVAERNSHMAVAPASNNKLFTTAAALDLLGPDFEFRTTLSVRGTVDPGGTLHGDVKITGRGDPTIGGRFHDGNATAVLEQFADDLKQNGINTVDGNLVFEHGYFDSEFVHPTWPKDQLTNWYEAPVAALSMQEGTVLVRVLPGRPGKAAVAQMEPLNRFMSLENSAVTRSGSGIFIGRTVTSNDIIVRGSVPPRSGATEVYVSVTNPLFYFANVTHDAFERNGVKVMGEIKLAADVPGDWKVIGEHSTPLPVVIYVINKVSQNQYAEQLLKTIGAEVKGEGSWASGTAAVEQWVHGKLGVPDAEFDMTDGSGMSRNNRASASAFTAILRYMWKQPFRREFVSSMPYTGEPESRLRRRLNQEPYKRQVYAKTGYISGVIGLSGYVHAQSGKVYAFSFLFNNYPTGVWGVYRLQDEMLKEIIKGG